MARMGAVTSGCIGAWNSERTETVLKFPPVTIWMVCSQFPCTKLYSSVLTSITTGIRHSHPIHHSGTIFVYYSESYDRL